MSDPMPTDNEWTYEAAREAANQRLIDQAARMIQEGTALGVALSSAMQPIMEAVNQLVDQFVALGWLSHYGRPVPDGVKIVKPAKGYAVWYGWRDGHWEPVHRVAGVGWVWSA